jgi:hypothetical protein
LLEDYDNNNKQRKEKYMSLKLEGIMDSALNICVTYDHTRFGPFVLGRTSITETVVYSICCATSRNGLSAPPSRSYKKITILCKNYSILIGPL